ncbi:MAG: hypothetical protein ACK5KL_04145 [Dysgonomonas sp.]
MKHELTFFFLLFLFYLSPARAQDNKTMDELPKELISVWDPITRVPGIATLFYSGSEILLYPNPVVYEAEYTDCVYAETKNGESHLTRSKHFTYYILKEAIVNARQTNEINKATIAQDFTEKLSEAESSLSAYDAKLINRLINKIAYAKQKRADAAMDYDIIDAIVNKWYNGISSEL